MSGYTQFGFGENDGSVGKKGKRFKMDKGEEARISFLWWPGLEKGTPNFKAQTPCFVGGPRHYMKGVGYFMNNGPEFTKIAGEAPKTRIATLVVKWPLKAGGKLDTEALAEGRFDVLYWVFDDGKYDEIKPIHNEWHFGTCDLKIKCSDAQFQKMAFSPTKESVLLKLAEKPDHPLWQNLLTQAQAMLANIQDEVGRNMTIDQIREKLAGGGGGVGGGGGGLGGGVVGGSSEDMDDALGKILDD